jgi:hypothetical protein
MNIIEIRLENGSLDLLPKAERSFYVNKVNHNLGDLETREASNSKTIPLPLTSNNIGLIGDQLPSIASSNDSTSYDFIDCSVFMFGLPVFPNAKLLVGSETNNNTVSITVFSDQVSFFDALSDSNISELDWSAYDLTWDTTDLTTIVNTTSGLLYASSVWSDNTSFNNAISNSLNEDKSKISEMDLNNSGCFMYIKTIFQKIIDSISDFIFDTSLIEDDIFNNLVLGVPVSKIFDSTKELLSDQGKREGIYVNSADNSYCASDDCYIGLEFPAVEVDSPVGFFDTVNNEYVASASGFYNIDFEMRDFTAYAVSGGSPIPAGIVGNLAFMTKKVGGSWVFHNQWDVYAHPVYNSSSRYVDDFYLETGEKVKIAYRTNSGIPDTYLEYDGYFNVVGGGINTDYSVNISNYMPEISQKDFVKEIFKLFHVTINTLPNGDIQFDHWDKIPEAEEIDLTPYLDVEKEVSKTGTILSYAKENTFKYSDDELVNRTDTDYIMPILSEVIQKKKDIITSKFTASDAAANTITPNRISIPLFPYSYVVDSDINISINTSGDYTTTSKSDLNIGDLIVLTQSGVDYRFRVIAVASGTQGKVDDPSPPAISNTQLNFLTWEKNDIKLKLGLASVLGNMTINDGYFSTGTLTGRKVDFPDSLTWTELVANYYSNFEATLEKPLIVSMWFKLPVDIFDSLTFRQPAYVENDRYYINDVQQYGTTQYCRIELIRTQVAPN